MDREKLNKAAGEYSKKLGKCRDVTWNDGEYGFIAGADWLMQQPLSERLTDEEKCIVRKLHNRCGIEFYHLRDGLERIFGTDLFREK